jgi:hypothetical protein
MPHSARTVVAALVLAASSTLAACATHYIPNTDVEDTDENRDVIEFCEKYRNAVELKNIATLLQLASPKYYEDGGNADASDDIDYAGLKDYLGNKFADAKAIRYEIRYRSVSREDDRVFVDFTYSASFRIPGAKGDEWRRKVEDNRLELVSHKEGFLILAGM